MKTPSDYDELIYKAVYIDSDEDKEKVYRIINQVIKDAWNDALDVAADSAEAIEGWNTGFSGNAASVDKQSILKLKI